MNSISLGKRKNLSAVRCSFRLNIGFSFIYIYFLFEECHFFFFLSLLRFKEERESISNCA